MALSPNIPTSFVPKQTTQSPRRQMSRTSNAILIASIIIAGISILVAGAVFAYEQYLIGVEKHKATQLGDAESHISADKVAEFVRLSDRLNGAESVLNQHVAMSQFFDVLESITLENVHFSSLHLNVASDRTAHVDMVGTARTFNALAAQSANFAADKRIKRAIFSGISVNQNGTVHFSLSADLDSKLVIMQAASVSTAPQGSTTTATTSSLVPNLPPTTSASSTAASSSAPAAKTPVPPKP